MSDLMQDLNAVLSAKALLEQKEASIRKQILGVIKSELEGVIKSNSKIEHARLVLSVEGHYNDEGGTNYYGQMPLEINDESTFSLSEEQLEGFEDEQDLMTEILNKYGLFGGRYGSVNHRPWLSAMGRSDKEDFTYELEDFTYELVNFTKPATIESINTWLAEHTYARNLKSLSISDGKITFTPTKGSVVVDGLSNGKISNGIFTKDAEAIRKYLKSKNVAADAILGF